MTAFLFLCWALPASAVPSTSAQHITGRGEHRETGLDCATDPCAEVLPGAIRFEVRDDKPYTTGLDAQGEVVGWVGLSTEIVGIMGYSGKPLITVVGLSTDGTIAGARVVYHSEPILLVGIPEQRLHDFVDAHVGQPADRKVTVGGQPSDEGLVIDAVSGATVTVLAESQTLTETARAIAEDVGVIKVTARVPGHFVDGESMSWRALTGSGALGHLRVTQDEMGQPADPDGRPFVELWFGIVDAPQVGIPLLGERTWRREVDRLEPGEHLFVVFNAGSTSFKGSGFVRGGLFDRFRLEQGLRTITFRDMDYKALDAPPLPDTPVLWESGLFFARDGALDPGRSYDLVFLASAYATERGAFERDFRSFSSHHRVPRSIYVLDGPDPEQAVWRDAWRLGGTKAAFVAAYLTFIALIFALRRFTTARMARLHALHLGVQAFSFVVLGLVLHVQPSVTQLLTIAGSVKAGWNWGLFLTDPVLFVSWIFIAVMVVIWGRGVFCGWACPYGAMNELCFKLGRTLGLPELELPDWIHLRARTLRYAVFGGLLVAFLIDAELGERLAEIEPFKSTFFVPLWTRHPALILWWVVLFAAAFTTYRPFCRYICPLGAALAVPSTFRLSGPYRRSFCSKCKICTRGCEPRAIRSDGSIDPRECLNCWECEANWRDDQVCPPLVSARRIRERAPGAS